MVSNSLESLTNELFERIVFFLNLKDIRSLRLASRSTAYKATQDTFRYFFRTKHVNITESDLNELVHLTSKNRLGILVEDLSLVGLVYNPFALDEIVESGERYPTEREIEKDYTLEGKAISLTDEEWNKSTQDLATLRQRQQDDEAFRTQGKDVALLTQAFRNLAARHRRHLSRLSLQIAVYRNDGSTKLSPLKGKCWRWNVEAASRTFSLAMTCLRDSQISVHTLDIFGQRPWSLSCNLPCEVLAQFDFDSATFGACFTGLKALSIHISDPIIVENERDAQFCGDYAQDIPFHLHSQKLEQAPLMARLRDQRNYSSLSKLLRLCPDIEDLEISGFVVGVSDPSLKEVHIEMRKRHMHYLAQMEPLAKLHRLRLAGLPVLEQDLTTFLVNHRTSLRQLEMQSLSMKEGGSFAPIFAFLTSARSALETVHFEDLSERRGVLLFDGETEQDGVKIEGAYFGRNVMKRWGEAAKKEIQYHFWEGMSIDTPRTRKWHQHRREEFGGRW